MKLWPRPKRDMPAPASDAVRPLELTGVTREGGKVLLKLVLSREFHRGLTAFMEKQGFFYFGHEKDGIPLLLRYGLSHESRNELERNKNELDLSAFAARNFASAELYQDNMALTLRLRQMLRQNRTLKRKLVERGQAEYISADPWDNWGDDYIAALYNRYVPCQASARSEGGKA